VQEEGMGVEEEFVNLHTCKQIPFFWRALTGAQNCRGLIFYLGLFFRHLHDYYLHAIPVKKLKYPLGGKTCFRKLIPKCIICSGTHFI